MNPPAWMVESASISFRRYIEPAGLEVAEWLERSVQGCERTVIIYPRIGGYDHIWTGLCRFFSVFLALEELFFTGASNLRTFLIDLVPHYGTCLAEGF